MSAIEVTYTGNVFRGGISAEVVIIIETDDWVEDHDELAERVGVEAMRLVRHAVTTRDNHRARPPAF